MKNIASAKRMTMALSVACLAGFFLQKQANAHGPTKDSSYQVVNLMDNFWKFWRQAEGKDTIEKLELFREMVIKPDKNFYDLIPGNITDERLNKYITGVAPLIPAMHQLSDKFPGWLVEGWKKFARVFTDIKGKTKLCMMSSIGTFDGMSRQLRDTTVLLFGIDQIARNSGTELNFIPQIQHELVHLYHAQVAPQLLKSRELYANLWIEGLAVYISNVLNQGATRQEIYLSDSLPRLVTSRLPELVKELRQKLYSTLPEDRRDFFNTHIPRKDIPEKSGYYIGMLIVEQLAKK